MIRLKRLIKEIPELVVKGSKEIEITGICAHSKLVAPGNLFVAKKGRTHDGSRFIPDAIAAGATCVLTDIYDPFLAVTQLIGRDVAKTEAILAAQYFQYPSHFLKVIGITGTNGKTSCSFLIKHLLDQAHFKMGLVGSIGCIIGDHHFPMALNTSDVVTNHKLLREMVSMGCHGAILEVSSHGLDQDRVSAIDFDIALFTNLTQEHLDYHGTMEDYRRAKEKLFANLSKDKWAIFNTDDPHSNTLAHVTSAKKLTYGIDQRADLVATDIKISDKGVQFTAQTQGQIAQISSPLLGKFNIYNLLGTTAVGLCCGIPLEKCLAILKNFRSVPGRLAPVKNNLGLHIFVDYAHTEDALRNILETVNAFKKRRVITVFGCGGDRDRKKREKMGRVVNRLSDEAIITTDNPRSEDPSAIVKEILRGFSSQSQVSVELERKKAIEKAIAWAKPKDIVLIAGKGHETMQIFAHYVRSFDDAEVARQICLKKERTGSCASF